MSLTREAVFEIINKERNFQERIFQGERPTTHTGVSRDDRDADPSANILLLESYIRKAADEWRANRSTVPALREVAKVAAIAVRTLEKATESYKLLYVGLRDQNDKQVRSRYSRNQ